MSVSAEPRHGLRLVRTEPGGVRPVGHGQAIPLQTDWSRLLRDLTSFGLVDVKVDNPIASLRCLAEPWYAKVHDAVGVVNGPGLALVAAVDNLAGATIENGEGQQAADHVLRWYDWAGGEVLRVALTEESAWSSFHAMLVRQWAQRGTPRPASGDRDANTRRVLRTVDGADSGWEATGLIDSWYLRRPDDEAPCDLPGTPIDPTLIAPFLEVMAEQTCPLSIKVGNVAAIQQHRAEFFDFRGSAAETKLRGTTASFTLRHAQLAAASVIECENGSTSNRRVQLFDNSRRTVATLAAVTEDNGSDPWIWQTLVSALLD